MNAVLCPSCGSPNHPKARVCASCGAAMSSPRNVHRCPHCSAPLRPHVSFCAACGNPVSPGLPPSDADAAAVTRTVVIRTPDGRTEQHQLTRLVTRVGRGHASDITLDDPTISSCHLRIALTAGGVQVTDLGSTNGTMLAERRIPPHEPHPWHPGDALAIGDLKGDPIMLKLKVKTPTGLHTRPLGMHRLQAYERVTIGRDASSQLHLTHPTVSRHHAEIMRRDGGYAVRDLGSTNGTFVNGQRASGWVPLAMGDVIQVGPYKLVYDGEMEKLTASFSRGHRLDAMGLGMQIADDRMILQNIWLSVHAGEFVALVGGSGAGKSTLLKAMNGYWPATHGQMLIDGRLLYPNLDAYCALMGYVPQDDIIHQALPVRLALWYAARLRLPDATADEIEGRLKDVLQMVRMERHAEKPVKVLSGGQRKRVSIAVELLAEPDLLFLDEPTSGLDPGLEKKMMHDLNRLADQGRTVVLVTHATANIDQCDQVAFLAQGELAYYGPPERATRFFGADDFADIYVKLADTINPAEGKQPPAELEPYYRSVMKRLSAGAVGSGPGGSVSAGIVWGERYRHSSLYGTYVVKRQRPVEPVKASRRQDASRGLRSRADSPPRDSALRQLGVLARRQFSLIRHDVRTLFILLMMMPIIAGLFMAVSDKRDLTGWQLSQAQVDAVLEQRLEERLDSGETDVKEDYLPEPEASQLVTMLCLALTQAGTFGAAYEIVKERSIFKREHAVNLRVSAYVLSKALVLGAFALVQVASSLLILGLGVDLRVVPILDIFPSGAWELFFTLFMAIFASIMLGLFISAVIPSADVVLYVILIQLFVQIILSGALFPLPDNPVTRLASKMVISHWTMDSVGSTVDIPRLNEESRICTAVERPDPSAGGTETMTTIRCESAARDEEELGLAYEHTTDHLLTTWGVLMGQAILWCGLTIVVQARKEIA